MTSHRAVPPLLQAYLELPRELSTTVVTSVLGASANWLLERYIVATLSLDSVQGDAVDGDRFKNQEVGQADNLGLGVVLVSWMRDLETWRTEVRRASGIDLSKVANQGRFTFVDGLSSSIGGGHASRVLTTALAAVQRMTAERKVLVLLDQPDVAVAASAVAPGLQIPDLLANITAISRIAHSTVISIAADSPLMSPASAAAIATDDTVSHAFAALESQHAALLTSLIHQAKHVLQLRKLETGWAKDVSGVLRICRGGGWEDEDEEGRGSEGRENVERELLYHVRGDGSVKVFERGAYASS